MEGMARQRVLVINDDVALAMSVRDLLRASGYEAECAFDGQQGLEVLARWPADLVLLDLIMPGLDGWGFLEQSAANYQSPEARPKIVVWSVAGSDERARAKTLGATECLSRESTGPDELLAAIARVLDRSTATEHA